MEITDHARKGSPQWEDVGDYHEAVSACKHQVETLTDRVWLLIDPVDFSKRITTDGGHASLNLVHRPRRHRLRVLRLFAASWLSVPATRLVRVTLHRRLFRVSNAAANR
jgi:hypothetical protein